MAAQMQNNQLVSAGHPLENTQGTECGDDQGGFHGARALNMAPQDEIAQLLAGRKTDFGEKIRMISMGML